MSKPDLRVELPTDDSIAGSQAATEGTPSGGRWNKVLQSPQVFMEKTASFTNKITGSMKRAASAQNQRPMSPFKGRQSVEPNRRAAMDAQYRTSLYLRQVSLRLNPLLLYPPYNRHPLLPLTPPYFSPNINPIFH